MESIRELFRIGHGPSSSHTLGPGRAAEHFRHQQPEMHHVTVTLYGSLAATGRGHLTDQTIESVLAPVPVQFVWKPETTLPRHPNAMTFTAYDAHDKELDEWTAYSVGGGTLRDDIGTWDTGSTCAYSLSTMDSILEWCQSSGRQFWEYVQEAESDSLFHDLDDIWTVMEEAVQRGLNAEGVLPGELNLPRKAASYYMKAQNAGRGLQAAGLLAAYGLAVAEENAAGGLVVTAPTCGSSGVVPAVLTYLKNAYNIDRPRIIRALATAGLIGILVKHNASISGAEVGCQGEIGTACAMASGAAAQLLGGTVGQVEYAAEMGMEHHLGLTCDPVGGYVQIPCIERNAVAAGRALQCATLSLFSDGRHRISFDEVITTMKETGLDLGESYKETSRSGLARHWMDSENRKNNSGSR